MKNKKGLRIIAGLGALVLIIGLLILTNAFLGNPIAGAMAKNSAQKLIDKNYKDLNLKLDKPVYNFKLGEYMIKAYSESSKDTHFTIYYTRKETRDDYDYTVGDKFNTFMRLENEYSKLVKDILTNKLGYKDKNSWVTLEKGEYEQVKDKLELDMDFDRRLPLEAQVNLSLELEDASLDKIIKILEDSHRVFLEEDCIFEEYGTMIGDDDRLFNISGLKPSQIENGQLEDLFNKALETEYGEYEGLSIFIKEDKEKN